VGTRNYESGDEADSDTIDSKWSSFEVNIFIYTFMPWFSSMRTMFA
jgi:hypothetical protein